MGRSNENNDSTPAKAPPRAARARDPQPPADASPVNLSLLIQRVGMMNRVQAALRSTLDPSDIQAIVLTTAIARSALGFSRAFLLEWDTQTRRLNGLGALGAHERRQHQRLHREIEAEQPGIAVPDNEPARLITPAEEQALFHQSMREAAHHAFWIVIHQKFEGASAPLRDALRQVSLELDQTGTSPLGEFIESVLQAGGARVVTPERLRDAQLPAALVDLLPAESLWATISSQRGPRLVLVVDRLFQTGPITRVDQLHVDWFVGQVSLALENVEMVQDLEQAYRSIRALDQLKSNFLATISHELRTPLTAITGYVQLLLGGKIGAVAPGQREVLERILAHGDLLTHKVNDILEIAEMDADQARDVRIRPVDPLSVLMRTLPRLERRRSHKGLSIEPEIRGPVPEILTTESALERIYFHLLDNAIKFGRPGGVVRVRFTTEADQLHIAVIDDGIGIARGQLRLIFEAFYQVDSNLTRQFEGLGIGLAIIKKQLEMTGGRITVESEPGRGSTFTIIYPVVQ